jgi:hypothetical protein
MKVSKSIRLVLASILVFVIVMILILHAWLPGELSGKIEDEIRSGLSSDSSDLYDAEAGRASFSTLFRTTRISEIRIVPKDIALNEKDASLLPRQIFETEVYNLNISSWTIVSLALGWKDIKAHRLSADSIFLSIYSNESGSKKTDSAQGMNIEHLHLKDFSLNKLRIRKRSLADTSGMVLQTGKLGFNGVISFYGKEQEYFLNPGIKANSLKVSDAGGFLSQGLYTYRVDSISFDGKENAADLSGLRMIPRYSKQEFHKHVQYETDRFDLMLEHIKISGFQSEKAVKEGSVVLSQIELNGGKLEVLRDRKPPFNEQQRPQMPVRLIRDAPFRLFAGKIHFNKIDIVYAEVPKDSDTAGEIPFKQLSATINNITNLEDSLASDSTMNIRAEASIFGKAILKAEFKYNLTDPYGTYEAKGSLSELRFTDINSAIYPLTGLKVNEGLHQNTSFYFYGNDVRSVGELRMQYTGLEIELNPDGKEIFKDIARSSGKAILYHQENPSADDELRVGEIEFDRDVSRFVFNYWWKTYLSGIKDSLLKDHFSL